MNGMLSLPSLHHFRSFWANIHIEHYKCVLLKVLDTNKTQWTPKPTHDSDVIPNASHDSYDHHRVNIYFC